MLVYLSLSLSLSVHVRADAVRRGA
eukprot:COSAG03_NODE_12109_length_560_cov_3.026030_3_plen_24_part_01